MISSGWNIQRLEDTPSGESLWRSLESRPANYGFQSHDWLNLWLETVGRSMGVEPCAVVVHDDHGPAMLFPLCIADRDNVACLEFMGSGVCDYNCPLMRPDVPGNLDRDGLRRLWKDICELLPPHDVVSLRKMPESLADGSPNPMLGLRSLPHAFSSHAITLDCSWDQFRDQRYGEGKRKKRLNQRRNKLNRLGEVEFVVARDGDTARRITEETLRRKKDWLERQNLEHDFDDPARNEFYLRAAAELAPRLVHVSALAVDGRYAATHFGMAHNDRFCSLVSAYDPGELSKCSPSLLLLEDLIKWSMDSGLSIFDLSIGEADYKNQWCNRKCRMMRHVEAHSTKGAPAWAKTCIKGLAIKGHQAICELHLPQPADTKNSKN